MHTLDLHYSTIGVELDTDLARPCFTKQLYKPASLRAKAQRDMICGS